MTTEKLTQPLRWHGGKGAFNGKLAKWIISLMPPRGEWHLFSEPYLGGAAVSLHMDPEGISEIHNDIDGDLTNFWEVLRCPTECEMLQRFLEATPLSQGLFEAVDPPGPAATPVYRAWRFFIRCRQSRAGKMKHFATPTGRTRCGMNENVSAWLSAVDGLPAVHNRIKRIEIRNMDAVEFIKEVDHPKRLFYCDPPYLHKTRASTADYKYEMTEEQHGNLLECLSLVKGRFLLSGYRSDLYDDWTSTFGWTRHELKIPNSAAGGKKKRTMTECAWTNY